MSQETDGTRRTANMRIRGRAARVVEDVFTATAEELSRVGYAAMRVEDVATRSGVNKTTIYRRWPTKGELVAATMVAQVKQRNAIDTGTLRGDLRASLLSPFTLKSSEQGMLRMVQTERAAPEVEALAHRFRDMLQRMRLTLVERGIARGELPKGVDAKLIVDLVSAPSQRALLLNEKIHESYIDRVLDVVLAGAAASARKPRAARKPAQRGATKARKRKQATRPTEVGARRRR